MPVVERIRRELSPRRSLAGLRELDESLGKSYPPSKIISRHPAKPRIETQTSASQAPCPKRNALRTTRSARTSLSSAQSQTRTSTAPRLRSRVEQGRMVLSYERYVHV